MTNWTDEQLLAITKDNSNIIVSAGAGSGKTAVLTERTIRKLESGISINELLILTFTNKAANEMKERIRKAISKNPNLKEQLTYIDNSYITTFDSYALSLVRKNHYLLGLDSTLNIIDSSIINIQKKKIIDNVFEGLYRRKTPLFLSFINNFTSKDDSEIKKDILNINNRLDLKYDKEEYLDNLIINNYSEKLDGYIAEYERLLINKRDEINEYLEEISFLVDSEYFENLKSSLISLLNANSYDSFKEALNVKMPNLPRNSEDTVKELKTVISNKIKELTQFLRFSDLKELRETFIQTKDYVLLLIEIIKEIDKELMDYKFANNAFEFIDISKFAIKIVKENDNIQRELKESFKEIMIDEYQDTSDLQEDFIKLIENDNVYMVGDIKQAIYRFRNANPYLFKSKYDRYSKLDNGFKIDLSKNFRSRKEVVSNINLIFDYIMSDNLGGADYRRNHNMIFGNKAYEKDVASQDFNMEIKNYEYEKGSIFSKTEIEIFTIAKDIEEKVSSNYQVFDRDINGLRNIEYKDFSILLDRSSSFDLYKQIFEHLNIPLTKYTTTNIVNEKEIYLIKNILKGIIALKNKDYDSYKYAYLSLSRSYLNRVDDEVIFSSILNKEYLDSDVSQKIRELLNELPSLSLQELLLLVIEKFDFYNKFITIGDLKSRENRISFLMDTFNMLSSLEYSIDDAYLYLEDVITEKYTLELKEVEEGNNSVKIMTIHASKGLEFPICYLAGLHLKFNIMELNDRFLINESYGIIAPYYNDGIGAVFLKDLVKENHLKEEISEKIRLFYVAITRAKEKVILVTSLFQEKKVSSLLQARSFLDMLLPIKEELNPYVINIDVESLDLTKKYQLFRTKDYVKEIKKTDEKLDFVKLNINKNPVVKKRISKGVSSLFDLRTKENIKEGIRVHRLFELTDFNNIDFTKENSKIVNFIKEINIDKVLNIYKEHEFIIEEETTRHGIIDLVLEYQDKFLIIDYKLDDITDDAYVAQLNEYRDYLLTKTNKPVEVGLYSVVKEKLMFLKDGDIR